LLATFACASQAADLFSQGPVPGIDGIQADESVGTYSQSFTVAPGVVLESIEWYGYHFPPAFGGDGPDADAFVVRINGVDVSGGVLAKAVVIDGPDTDLFKYTLDVVDGPISSGTLELGNGPATQWAWQYSDPRRETTAFTLHGSLIPEPGTYALMLAGLLTVAGIARGRRPRV
jgi:hypothetical protein